MQRWTAGADRLGPADLESVVELLERGGVVAVPTETYYGLAAHWRCGDGIDQVLRLKARAAGHPLLLLVTGQAMARRVAPQAPELLDRLAEVLWPGPLTLVVPGPPGLHPALLGAGGTVALRHSPHPILQQILDRLGEPVTGTSANASGARPATHPRQIELVAGCRLAGVVDAGTTPGGEPSTVLDLSAADPPRILRAGAVNAESIRRALL